VKCQEELLAALDVLEFVHPVGDDAAAVRVVAHIVPAGPKRFAARHEGGVRVKDSAVLGVFEGAEKVALLGARVVEHGKRFVAVRGNYDAVKAIDSTLRFAHPNAGAVAAHRYSARAKARVSRIRRGQLFDVGPAAAFNSAPLGTALEFQETMVLEEADESAGRIVVYLAH